MVWKGVWCTLGGKINGEYSIQVIQYGKGRTWMNKVSAWRQAVWFSNHLGQLNSDLGWTILDNIEISVTFLVKPVLYHQFSAKGIASCTQRIRLMEIFCVDDIGRIISWLNQGSHLIRLFYEEMTDNRLYCQAIKERVEPTNLDLFSKGFSTLMILSYDFLKLWIGGSHKLVGLNFESYETVSMEESWYKCFKLIILKSVSFDSKCLFLDI